MCRALTSPGDALDLHLTTSDFTRLNRTLTGQYIMLFSGGYVSIHEMEKRLFWSSNSCLIPVIKFGSQYGELNSIFILILMLLCDVNGRIV